MILYFSCRGKLKHNSLTWFSYVSFWLQGVHPCDKRHNVSDYQFLFPAVDFSLASTWISKIKVIQVEVRNSFAVPVIVGGYIC
jgi:hypothetical protein